jgi:hypothetical protein
MEIFNKIKKIPGTCEGHLASYSKTSLVRDKEERKNTESGLRAITNVP